MPRKLEKQSQSVVVEAMEERLLLAAVSMSVRYFLSAPQLITVTVRRSYDANFQSIYRNRLKVDGPNGFSTLIYGSINPPADGDGDKPYLVKYDMPMPGGEWDPSDNGTYKVSFTKPIKYNDGTTLTNLNLGQFQVALSGLGQARGSVKTEDPRPMAGVQVYVDANDDGILDSGEISVLTTAKGAF